MKYIIETQHPNGKKIAKGTAILSYADAKTWVVRLNHKYPELVHSMIEVEETSTQSQ
jgi:hypothetical protein